MPGLDRTGPRGFGPMTGGARGHCNPARSGAAPAYGGGLGYGRGSGRGCWGRGMGQGRGFGRGFVSSGWAGGRSFYPYEGGASVSASEEMVMLRQEAEGLNQALREIQNRIDLLEKVPEKDA